MAKPKSIDDCIKNTEYHLALYKCVLASFPDAKVRESCYPLRFSSKLVNSNYTNFKFEKRYRSIYVIPYSEIEFEHDNVTKTITIDSAPQRSRLACLSYKRDPVTKKLFIRFSRLAINFKNNNFKDDMLNSCRAQIMQFIKDNPDCALDTKHLEPRLKKLLLFT